MIRRDDGDVWHFIAQPDHALQAAELAAAWGNSHVAPLPHPELLQPAIRDHDDGWQDWEQHPELHPVSGIPRQFLEMPMATATEIWTSSIRASHQRQRHSAAVLLRFQQFLSSRSKRMTADRAQIARIALGVRGAFDADRIVDELTALNPDSPLSRSTVYRTLGWLEEAGLLLRDPRTRDRHIYRTSGPTIGPSPVPGLWVSRHFTCLAEQALEHRRETEDAEALRRFLAEQASLQAGWRAELAGELDAESAGRLEQSGFRWLQFFDRLSLWLSCAPRSQTEAMQPPDNGTIHFTPLKSGEIAVQPYPFRTPDFTVTTPARRLPARPYVSQAEFDTLWRTAPCDNLSWTFVQW